MQSPLEICINSNRTVFSSVLERHQSLIEAQASSAEFAWNNLRQAYAMGNNFLLTGDATSSSCKNLLPLVEIGDFSLASPEISALSSGQDQQAIATDLPTPKSIVSQATSRREDIGLLPDTPSPEIVTGTIATAFKPFQATGSSSQVLADGSIQVTQTATDGSTYTQTRHPDSSSQDKFADRYGRPTKLKDYAKDGSWMLTELQYQNVQQRISPFLSSKIITRSDGLVTEEQYGQFGNISHRHQYQTEV